MRSHEVSSDVPSDLRPLLVTGATGYVGGRLVARLLRDGFAVRAAGRSIDKLESRPWSDHANVELVSMDVFDAAQVEEAMVGCRAAYYLIHSMGSSKDDFESADRKAASIFRDVAERAGLEQILYLGGLGGDDTDASDHLQSRQEVGDILSQGSVPATIVRAAIIIGAGSASFEVLRHLVEKLPIMVTPRWVRTRTQPIAITSVLDYLVACIESQRAKGQTIDIGGPDVVSYGELMQRYAKAAGLPRRIMIPVPFLTPRLSSLWLHLVTPVDTEVARPLVEGLRNETTVSARFDAARLFPDVEKIGLEAALGRAIDSLQRQDVATYWSDAGDLPPADAIYPGDPPWVGAAYFDHRERVVAAEPESVWKPIVRIGGGTGYYWGNRLWRLRGLLDQVVGGPGLRRGRREHSRLRPGDALDFWRVLRIDQHRNLKLLAEMKVPGRAYLDFTLRETDKGTVLTQTASFEPRGVFGRLYWWSVWPLHYLVFGGMLNGIARAALEDSSGGDVRQSLAATEKSDDGE